ncbi:MAG: hypothetical protein GTN80_01715 [Nitrososphaeria archaeon]|nr:hypothetical protein [Nitrososphaeria archaeon]NIN51821.1 hypothetical protein [Nitrososphaeria archaeon]NIQ32356.1 hypothetical protein [Nitrososphaeria archaeon]
MSRRGKIELYIDILEAAQDRDRATHIANKAKTNYKQLQKSVEKLMDRGLLRFNEKSKLYEVTEHGKSLLKVWNKILEMLD